MKIGLFFFGLFWFLFGILLSYLGCFTDDICDYSSLIAPLPGIVLIFLSFKKTKSAVEEKQLTNLSSLYLKWLLFLLLLGVLLFVEVKFSSNVQVPLAVSILVVVMGASLLRGVYYSFKIGSATFHREGVIGHGFHTYKNTDKFRFWFTQILHTLTGLFFLGIGLYSFFHSIVVLF